METGSYVDLVIRARRGDVEAFGGLVERFQDMAVSRVWAELGDLADAVDATQDAFVRATSGDRPTRRSPARGHDMNPDMATRRNCGS